MRFFLSAKSAGAATFLALALIGKVHAQSGQALGPDEPKTNPALQALHEEMVLEAFDMHIGEGDNVNGNTHRQAFVPQDTPGKGARNLQFGGVGGIGIGGLGGAVYAGERMIQAGVYGAREAAEFTREYAQRCGINDARRLQGLLLNAASSEAYQVCM